MSTCRVKSNSIQTAPCWKRLAMMVKAMVGGGRERSGLWGKGYLSVPTSLSSEQDA